MFCLCFWLAGFVGWVVVLGVHGMGFMNVFLHLDGLKGDASERGRCEWVNEWVGTRRIS